MVTLPFSSPSTSLPLCMEEWLGNHYTDRNAFDSNRALLGPHHLLYPLLDSIQKMVCMAKTVCIVEDSMKKYEKQEQGN